MLCPRRSSRERKEPAVARADRFEGRTVVVTGGAGGIGRAVCRGFAAEGASVAVVDVDRGRATEVAAAIGSAYDVPTSGHVVDVRDSAAVTQMMAEIHAGLGGPEVLVCLAGGSLGTPR